MKTTIYQKEEYLIRRITNTDKVPVRARGASHILKHIKSGRSQVAKVDEIYGEQRVFVWSHGEWYFPTCYDVDFAKYNFK
ncbi:MAG: hypothetical protein ACPGGD_03160 [Thalassolituus sp.]